MKERFTKNYVLRITVFYMVIITMNLIFHGYRVTTFIMNMFVFYGTIKMLSYNKKVLLFLAGPLFFIVTTISLFATRYSVSIGNLTITLVNTNQSEIADYTTVSNIILLLFSLLYTYIAFFPIIRNKVAVDQWKWDKKHGAIILLFIICVAITYPYSYKHVIRRHLLNVIRYTGNGIEAFYAGVKFGLKSLEGNKKLTNYSYKGSHNMIVVFHIGESLRADHLGINGYLHNTTPYLSKENLINFGITKSFADHTILSISAIINGLKLGQDYDNIKNGTNIRSITDPYFQTFFIGSKIDYILYKILVKKDSEYIATKGVSFDLDKGLYKVLNNNSFDKPLFIMLRNNGSHSGYERRYPQSYLHYKTSTIEKINHYDRSVYYTDSLIAQEIKQLKALKKPVIFIYTSDHGESLGEKGIYYHVNGSVENFMSPLFVWVSDEYKKMYKEKYKNLVNNAKEYYNKVTHEVVWHSLLDGAGFVNTDPLKPTINYEKSLFSKQLKPQLKDDWFKVSYKRF